MWSRRLVVVLTLAVVLLGAAPPGTASAHARGPKVVELATFVDRPCADDICSTGSTVGPDGALYVTDGTAGRIQRIDPWRGTVSTYADGLPLQIPGVVGGGAIDVAFRGRTAYVMVAGVNEFWTQLVGSPATPAPDGLYRLDRVGPGTTHATLVADTYAWSEAHPPQSSSYFIPGGYPYAMQSYRDGFLVTDAHHNRILRVRVDGAISVFHDFGANVVPTGLDLIGSTVLVGQAGPVPHESETGRALALLGRHRHAIPLASGAPLLVDVEVGPRHRLYGLAQGDWPYEGQEGKEGFPAAPDTGYLMRADRHGHFRAVVSGLDRPTSLEIIGQTAFVITITGKVLRVSGLDR